MTSTREIEEMLRAFMRDAEEYNAAKNFTEMADFRLRDTPDPLAPLRRLGQDALPLLEQIALEGHSGLRATALLIADPIRVRGTNARIARVRAKGPKVLAAAIIDELDRPFPSVQAVARFLARDADAGLVLETVERVVEAGHAALLSATAAHFTDAIRRVGGLLPNAGQVRASRVFHALRDVDEATARALSTGALGAACEVDWWQELLQTCRGGNTESRLAFVKTVRNAPGHARGRELLPLLADPDPRVRRAALDGLRGCVGPDSIALVAERLDRDDDPETRCAAAETLGAMAYGHPSATEALIGALRPSSADSNRRVARAAMQALVPLHRPRGTSLLSDPSERAAQAAQMLDRALMLLSDESDEQSARRAIEEVAFAIDDAFLSKDPQLSQSVARALRHPCAARFAAYLSRALTTPQSLVVAKEILMSPRLVQSGYRGQERDFTLAEPLLEALCGQRPFPRALFTELEEGAADAQVRQIASAMLAADAAVNEHPLLRGVDVAPTALLEYERTR